MAQDPSSRVVKIGKSFSIEVVGIDPASAELGTEVGKSHQRGGIENPARPAVVVGDAEQCLCIRTKCPSPTAIRLRSREAEAKC